MDIEARIGCLKNIDLFQSFSQEELKGFAERISEIELNPKEILFEEGSPGSEMFILLDGTLKVFKESRSIAEIRPVDYIGEMAIIEAKPRSATVQAVGECRLLKITSAQFQSYLAEQPTSLVALMKTLSKRIRQDTEIIADEFEKANVIIHDMRNVLSVFLFLDVLKRTVHQDPQLKYIEFMRAARDNLAAMMEEALANAKRLYRPYPVARDNLEGLLREMRENDFLIHPDLKDKRIEINFNETLPEFSFCRLDIRRVIFNLVLNAGQASAAGDKIEICLGRTGDNAEVRVKDKGRGIPADLQDRIFHPHFTTREQGNGLGLYSCRDIVENRHGGTISFSSSPGEGCVFTFTLPLHPTADH